MRLDPELARRAFEALDTPLSLEQRVSFAYRLAVANIAEEVTNVAVRHGVDPRDFTLVAYGAAGPMLLPAALDLLQVARIVDPAAPRPVLGDGPAQHRPRLLREPQRLRRAEPRQRGAGRGRLPADGARAARAGRRGRRRRRGAPQPRRAPARPELGDAVRRGRRRADHGRRRCPRWSSASTTPTSAATATASRTCRSRASPIACSSSSPPTRSSTSRATAPASRRRRPRARSSCATSPTSRCSAAEHERESLPVGAVVHGPAVIREAALDDLRHARPGRRGRALRRDLDRGRRA